MKYKWVLATALISGFAIFMNAFSVAKFDPFVFTTLKNSFVVIGLLAVLYLGKQTKYLKTISIDDWKKLIVIGIVGGSVPFLLFFWGLKNSSAVTAAFIHKTMFIWVSLLAFVFLKERLTRKQIAGAGALLIGLFMFAGYPQLTFGLGELAVVAATLLWSIETIISKKVLATVKPTIVAAARMGFGLFVLIPFISLTSGFPALSINHYAWLLITGAFLLGYVFTWYHGLALVKASEATAVLLLGSVITSILSWAFLAKEIEFMTFLGIGLMLLGLTGMTKSLEVFEHVHRVPSKSPVRE